MSEASEANEAIKISEHAKQTYINDLRATIERVRAEVSLAEQNGGLIAPHVLRTILDGEQSPVTTKEQ